MYKLFLTFLLFLLLAACNQQNSKHISQELEKKTQEITALKEELTQLKQNLGEILGGLASRQNFIADKVNRNIYETVIFDPSTKSYASIVSPIGTLLISLSDIKKYANGYKITLLIGNPTLARLTDGILFITYGKPYDKNMNYNDWENGLKKIQVEVNKEILPGLWNKVSAVLSPAKEEDLGFIRIGFVTPKLFLLQDTRKNED